MVNKEKRLNTKLTPDQPYLDLQCGLAESPLWEEDENVLRFVDIVNSAVYRVHLSEGPSPLEKQTYKSAIWLVTLLLQLLTCHGSNDELTANTNQCDC